MSNQALIRNRYNQPQCQKASSDSHVSSVLQSNAAALQMLGLTGHPVRRSDVMQLAVKETPPVTRARDDTPDASGAAGISEIQNRSGAGQLYGTSPGTANPTGWANVPAAYRGLWIRFHLVNQQIGGLGNNSNLVPATQATNQAPVWRNFERDAQNEFNAGKWIYCRTTVTGYHAGNPGFPSGITGDLEVYDTGNQQWDHISTAPLTNIPPPPNFATGIVKLGNMTPSDWKNLFGNASINQLHRDLAAGLSGNHYHTYDDFYEFLYQENAPDLTNAQENAINSAIVGMHPTLNIDIF